MEMCSQGCVNKWGKDVRDERARLSTINRDNLVLYGDELGQ